MRAFVAGLLILLLLGGLAGFAWLTHHPETPWLARAERWPLVGPAARSFRRAWLPPLEREESGAGGPQSEVDSAGAADSSGAPSETGKTPEVIVIRREPKNPGSRPSEWVTPDTVLRAAPRPDAPVLHRFDLYANLPVLKRSGDWVRVRHGDSEGWVPARTGNTPLLGSAPAPNLPLPGRPPDEERLARAGALLGIAAPTGTLGSYPLWSDVDDRRLLRRLDAVAASVEDAYRRRYQRRPVGAPAEALVLFARQQDYRAFGRGEAELAGLPAAGHAGYGLAALYVQGRAEGEVAATLAHELTHLLNRRALGPALPSWLDEGLAGDLGGSAIAADGTLEPSGWGGTVTRGSERIEYQGIRASLLHLRRALAAGSLMPLARLTELDASRFVRSVGLEKNHEHAALFVRYLLDGDGGTHAAGFRAFLDGVAAGEPATAEALLAHLDLPWNRLEAGFRAWVTLQGAAL